MVSDDCAHGTSTLLRRARSASKGGNHAASSLFPSRIAREGCLVCLVCLVCQAMKQNEPANGLNAPNGQSRPHRRDRPDRHSAGLAHAASPSFTLSVAACYAAPSHDSPAHPTTCDGSPRRALSRRMPPPLPPPLPNL